MDLLFEVILGIIFEASIEGMKAKTIPTWIRIVCTIIASSIFLLVIGMVGTLALFLWKGNQILLSILFLIVDLIFVMSAIKRISKFKTNGAENEK